uniref:Uncharacterized protein n=1 Tax=Tectiviridae sp. cthzn51 TaxID=2826821 RepID=A0A8S5LUB9_9VIRU|nr:MAG TPA: hypothetical protein [Tectiviridae sp. cthzn51]
MYSKKSICIFHFQLFFHPNFSFGKMGRFLRRPIYI